VKICVICGKEEIKMIKNDLFLKALNNETVNRPPVWMMRQAGRYLPEFMAIKEKYDFFTRCKTPELASEITVQPIRIIKPDAAILFSDILVVPQAMGIQVELQDNIGPVLPNPIRKASDVDNVFIPDINETLGYVMDAIDMTREKLNNEVPLIGFAGSPWTIFCYAVEGKGSKSFDKAKGFCFTEPAAAHALLQKNHRYYHFIFKRKSKTRCQRRSNFRLLGRNVVTNRLSGIFMVLHEPNRRSSCSRNQSYRLRKRMLVRPKRYGKIKSISAWCRLDHHRQKRTLPNRWKNNAAR